MRKCSFFLAIFLLFSLSLIQNTLVAKIDFDTYRAPSSSYHCKELGTQRSENLRIKQKLTGLLERNTRLIKNTPREKESIYRKLVFLRGEIKFKLEKHIFKLKAVEENIVRRGCPSILSTNI